MFYNVLQCFAMFMRKTGARWKEGGELETTSLVRVEIEGECIAAKAKLLQFRHLCFCKFLPVIFFGILVFAAIMKYDHHFLG